jgi:putative SOS response-associated peptidase YedK
LQASCVIAPTATIDVLIPRNSDQLELWQMGWGPIPSWRTKTRKELERFEQCNPEVARHADQR